MKCDVYDVQQGDVAEYKADDIVGSPDCTAEAFDIPPGAEGVVSADEAFHIPPAPDAAKYKADATYGAPAPPLQPIQVAPPAAEALRTAPQCPSSAEVSHPNPDASKLLLSYVLRFPPSVFDLSLIHI